ncbi:hypothetical protein AB0M43_12235 [Longispora sp. NPDC051575]|uniref:hypothetical protein n=1 Tax=Longispora sp. NPDC051575 TaxID=3154943 RepID=UPI003437CF5B
MSEPEPVWRMVAPPTWGERPTRIAVSRSRAAEHFVFMVDVERRYLLLSEMEAWAVWAVMTEAVHSIGDPPAWAVDTATGATSTRVTTMGGEWRRP